MNQKSHQPARLDLSNPVFQRQLFNLSKSEHSSRERSQDIVYEGISYGGKNMATIINPFLFSWNDVEVRSDLDRFYLVRDNLPDKKIVMEFEDRRGNGRDEFPVRTMWNAIIS